MLCGAGVIVSQMQLLLLRGFKVLRNEFGVNTLFTFYLVPQVLIANTTTLNHTEDRDVLDKTLFGGTELVRGNTDPPHVFRRLTALIPNARGVSKATLASDAAAMKATFNENGGGQAAAGSGIRAAGASIRASHGAERVPCVRSSIKLPVEGPRIPPLSELACMRSKARVRPACGCQGIVAPAPSLRVPRSKAPTGRAQARTESC